MNIFCSFDEDFVFARKSHLRAAALAADSGRNCRAWKGAVEERCESRLAAGRKSSNSLSASCGRGGTSAVKDSEASVCLSSVEGKRRRSVALHVSCGSSESETPRLHFHREYRGGGPAARDVTRGTDTLLLPHEACKPQF